MLRHTQKRWRCSGSDIRLVLLGWFENAETALLGDGELCGPDVKAVKNATLLRCVVFA